MNRDMEAFDFDWAEEQAEAARCADEGSDSDWFDLPDDDYEDTDGYTFDGEDFDHDGPDW